MDAIDRLLTSPAFLRGRAAARVYLASTAETEAERREHERLAELYERAITDPGTRQRVAAHDRKTRFNRARSDAATVPLRSAG